MATDDPNFLESLWVQYWANGGRADRFGFDAFLQGLFEPDEFDQQILTWAFESISLCAGYSTTAAVSMEPKLPPLRTNRPNMAARTPTISN
jgi:hypothetical protein